MLALSQLDLIISSRLEVLRTLLNDAGILVAALPKEAGAYSDSENQGGISVMIPQVTGTAPAQPGLQELIYLIIIRLVLPKRYQDNDSEINVIEFVVDKIVHLLIGYNPFPANANGRSLYLQSYDMLQPSAGKWEAELRFQCSRLLAYPITDNNNENDEAELESVQLFASNTLSELDAILTAQIPQSP